MAYLPINEHGLIGDLHTAGLVAFDGRLVWLPWTHFDSPSIFAALLDDKKGGDWLMAPAEVTASRQAYHGNSAVLVTTFDTPTGRVELWDWMSPWDGKAPGHDVCRVLRCVEGEVRITGRFSPRPDYARELPKFETKCDGVCFDAQGTTFHFKSTHLWKFSLPGSETGQDAPPLGTATLDVVLRAGEEVRCTLCSGGSLLEVEHLPDDLQITLEYWRKWSGQCEYTGPYEAAVIRSAITLKLLTHATNGAIVAAPTTSLPECIGGPRNWDYRYTWLRDASFTLDALCNVGFHEEEGQFFQWLVQLAQKHHEPMQIMYGIDGREHLTEIELDHLEGYRGSRPVRIGNAAYDQRQLDVFGGVLDAALAYTRHKNRLRPQEWAALRDEIEFVCAQWNEPDQGIWEIRGPGEHHLFSKLMCWVTVDRGIGLADHEGWSFDRDRWVGIRDSIRESILTNGWNPRLNAYTMAYGSDALDASVLVMPSLGFLPGDDPRFRSTVDLIKQRLCNGPLVYRYRADDHLAGDEGAFLLCSFWMVDALAHMGQVNEARERFEALLKFSSTHGLLSEEVDPANGMALGNYPQAFSHIGLINSASLLARASGKEGIQPSEDRAHQGTI